MNKIQKLLVAVFFLAIYGVALYNSYWHIVGVALRSGEGDLAAHLLPILPDAALPVSVVALSIATISVSTRVKAKITLWSSTLFTLGANAMAAVDHRHGMISFDLDTVIAFVVAGWPAVTMFLAAEVVIGIVKSFGRRTAPRVAVKAAVKPVKAPVDRAAAARKAAATRAANKAAKAVEMPVTEGSKINGKVPSFA